MLAAQHKINFFIYPAALLNRMSSAKNASRMSYTSDHIDGLSILNSGEVTLMACHFLVTSLYFSKTGIKDVLKSIIGVTRGWFSISTELLIFTEKLERGKVERKHLKIKKHILKVEFHLSRNITGSYNQKLLD